MKKIALMFFRVAWTFFRLYVALILGFLAVSFVSYIVYTFSELQKPRVDRGPNVCGKISGVTFEFSRKYLLFIPEFEGRSIWDPRFVENKQGCDANLKTLSLAMSWPAMKPVRPIEMYSYDFNGVVVTVEPAPPEFSDMRWRMESYFVNVLPEQIQRAEYLSELGLYYFRGAGFILKSSEDGYYWEEKGGKINYLINCSWLKHESKYSTCNISFLVPRFSALVSIDFPWENMREWRKLVKRSVIFIEQGLKPRGK